MIFYLSGPDSYRAFQKLNELKEKFRREVDPTGASIQLVDGSVLTVDDLSHVFETSALFARRRFVIVRNLLKSKDKKIPDHMIRLLSRHEAQGNNLIIFSETDEPVDKSPLHQWLLKHAYHQRFPVLQARAVEGFIKTEFKKSGRDIETGAIRLLIERTGGDPWPLSREIAKIDAYLEPVTPVDAETVRMIGSEPSSDDVFPLIDAIIRGDRRHAAPMLMSYLAHGQNAQSLVALLESQLRALILLTTANGRTAQLAGVHPFVARKLAPLSRRYHPDDIKKVYAALSEVDVELKTTGSDPKTIILQFLFQLTPT